MAKVPGTVIGRQPAFASPGQHTENGETIIQNQVGMTLRQYIATHVLAGLVASDTTGSPTPEEHAIKSVRVAAALLEELAK